MLLPRPGTIRREFSPSRSFKSSFVEEYELNMAEAKKKLKKKTKIRESHRTFDRRIISEAKESLDGGKSVDFKKLKSFKSAPQEKVLELKGMDQEVLEYLDDSKIDEDVSYSCDFASAIQACIVDLETALVSEKE